MNERKLLFLMTAEQADAFARLVEAAGRGDGGAACRLGDMYREGLGGLRYSPKETYRWYAKSALAGDANGQNNLGACYEHGLGCTQSYAKAVKWYRLSVAQGLGTASMNIGYCYLRGHGVVVDRVEALRLFREAVERGEEDAAREVERLERGCRPRQLALVDTSPRANSGGCSASSASTPGAPQRSAPGLAADQPTRPAVGARRDASLPCELALGVVHRDGLPRRLQPPDRARRRSRMVPRERQQRSETGSTHGIGRGPEHPEPPNSAPSRSRDAQPENLGAAEEVARPEPDAAVRTGVGDVDPRGDFGIPELLPRTVSRQGAESEPPGKDPRRVREASSGMPKLPRVRFVDRTQAGKHLGLVVVDDVRPPLPWEDEDLRRELLDVLSTETASPADGDELYAGNCGVEDSNTDD